MSEHVPELEISLFVFDPEAFPPERRAEIERHTALCGDCGAHVDFYSLAEQDLSDPTVWRPSLEATAARMSAYAHQCAAEDAEADRLLEPYFANPVRAAWNLSRQREFRTGGVVRRLNAKAHSLFASKPLAALVFADSATAIAEALLDDTYPNLAVYELRGAAWKERANALIRLSRFDAAIESARRAERAYSHLGSSGHGVAAVALLRAAVFYQRHKLDVAAEHAAQAEREYAHIGDVHGRMNAVFLRGGIKYEALEFEAAAAIFQQTIDFGEEAHDPQWIAKGSYAKGNCELDLGNLGEASILFVRAFVIFRETGPASDRISTDWGLGRVVLHGGNPTGALERLRDVVAAFERIGMVSDAALASLDVADALLMLGRVEEITKVAKHAFNVLKKAGIHTGALTAMAYVKESAAKRRLSRPILKEVRSFLRRVERQPDLLFVPPPETSA